MGGGGGAGCHRVHGGNSPSGGRPRRCGWQACARADPVRRRGAVPPGRGGCWPYLVRRLRGGRDRAPRRPLVPGPEHHDLARRSVQQPRDVRGGEARGALGRGGDDDLVVALVRDQLAQRVAVGAAALDPASTATPARAARCSIGLEQRQRELALARQRARRAAGAAAPSRGRRATSVASSARASRSAASSAGSRQRAADEREQDPRAAVRMRARRRRRWSQARPRRRRPRDGERRRRVTSRRGSSVLLRRRARSATMRTSTPGSAAAAGRRARAAPAGAARCAAAGVPMST